VNFVGLLYDMIRQMICTGNLTDKLPV